MSIASKQGIGEGDCSYDLVMKWLRFAEKVRFFDEGEYTICFDLVLSSIKKRAHGQMCICPCALFLFEGILLR